MPLPPPPLPTTQARHRRPSEPRLSHWPLALPPSLLRRRPPEQPPPPLPLLAPERRPRRRPPLLRRHSQCRRAGELVRGGVAAGSRRCRDVMDPGVAVMPAPVLSPTAALPAAATRACVSC
ncbi:hypothetical protein DAI22_12g131050 [Oryza sativa Japonica Group]|nr:hypothetical protein DAI22_12g131050 [Oryza sativa Japonica Group]